MRDATVVEEYIKIEHELLSLSYGKIEFIIEIHWKFLGIHTPNNPKETNNKEKQIQSHTIKFFVLNRGNF